jgi:hypothetical protein
VFRGHCLQRDKTFTVWRCDRGKTGLGRAWIGLVLMASLIYRIEKKVFLRLGWDALALIFGYMVNIYFLYALRGRG